MASLLSLFHLVKFQKAGSGAEDICVALPLINNLSVHQNLSAVGARLRKIHVGESGLCRRGVTRQGEDRTNLQVLLSKTEQRDDAQ